MLWCQCILLLVIVLNVSCNDSECCYLQMHLQQRTPLSHGEGDSRTSRSGEVEVIWMKKSRRLR